MSTSIVPCVLVIDAFELRRVGIAAVLTPWAKSISAAIVSLSPEELDSGLPAAQAPALVVLSVGGLSLQTAHVVTWTVDIRQRLPQVPCLVLSDRTEPEEALMAARLGAQAFMSTSVGLQFALQACAMVAGGGTYFPNSALRQVWGEGQEAREQPHAGSEGLTQRQREVLKHLCLGRPNKLIARSLCMQESTVKVHVREIMRKLGARNRTEAAMLGGGGRSTQLTARPSLGAEETGAAARDRRHFVHGA